MNMDPRSLENFATLLASIKIFQSQGKVGNIVNSSEDTASTACDKMKVNTPLSENKPTKVSNAIGSVTDYLKKPFNVLFSRAFSKVSGSNKIDSLSTLNNVINGNITCCLDELEKDKKNDECAQIKGLFRENIEKEAFLNRLYLKSETRTPLIASVFIKIFFNLFMPPLTHQNYLNFKSEIDPEKQKEIIMGNFDSQFTAHFNGLIQHGKPNSLTLYDRDLLKQIKPLFRKKNADDFKEQTRNALEKILGLYDQVVSYVHPDEKTANEKGLTKETIWIVFSMSSLFNGILNNIIRSNLEKQFSGANRETSGSVKIDPEKAKTELVDSIKNFLSGTIRRNSRPEAARRYKLEENIYENIRRMSSTKSPVLPKQNALETLRERNSSSQQQVNELSEKPEERLNVQLLVKRFDRMNTTDSRDA